MRTALLLLFFPLFLSAQNGDLLERPYTPVQGLKSIRITTKFESVKKDKDGKRFVDTAFKETIMYNQRGELTLKTYASVLDKSTFTSRTEYSYGIECWWQRRIFENGQLRDSSYTTDCGIPTATRYIYSATGLHEIYIIRKDSIFNTIVDTPDTIRRNEKRTIRQDRDPDWDYSYAESFARKNISQSNGVDSIRYFDAKGQCMFMIVKHYDEAKHPIKTEYFNYHVKTFVVLVMRYNERMSISEFVVKSKKNKPSYTIEREYYDNGLVKKETYQWQRKGRTAIIKDYTYEFY